jgi:hypothetical protein
MLRRFFKGTPITIGDTDDLRKKLQALKEETVETGATAPNLLREVLTKMNETFDTLISYTSEPGKYSQQEKLNQLISKQQQFLQNVNNDINGINEQKYMSHRANQVARSLDRNIGRPITSVTRPLNRRVIRPMKQSIQDNIVQPVQDYRKGTPKAKYDPLNTDTYYNRFKKGASERYNRAKSGFNNMFGRNKQQGGRFSRRLKKSN